MEIAFSFLSNSSSCVMRAYECLNTVEMLCKLVKTATFHHIVVSPAEPTSLIT